MLDVSMIVIISLSTFVGFYVIRGVTHALHAPLMSITNAISSVVIVGSIYMFYLGISKNNLTISLLSCISSFIASVNIGGGFTISSRMINMFKKKS
jgi:NAD(P) transhydrogenase subunit alpha